MRSDEYVWRLVSSSGALEPAHLEGMTYPMLSARHAHIASICQNARNGTAWRDAAKAVWERRLACVRQFGECDSTDDALF